VYRRVFGYFGLAICVLNDGLFIRSLVSFILVCTVLNIFFKFSLVQLAEIFISFSFHFSST